MHIQVFSRTIKCYTEIHTIKNTLVFEMLNVKSFLHWQKGFDVFNALDLMENKTFLEKLKFGIGDGNLHYYLYNWRCPGTDSEKVREVDIPL